MKTLALFLTFAAAITAGAQTPSTGPWSSVASILVTSSDGGSYSTAPVTVIIHNDGSSSIRATGTYNAMNGGGWGSGGPEPGFGAFSDPQLAGATQSATATIPVHGVNGNHFYILQRWFDYATSGDHYTGPYDASSGTVNIYLTSPGGPPSTNSVVCATANNQQPFGVYYGFTDATGALLSLDSVGSQEFFVAAGSIVMKCITVGTGTNVSLVMVSGDSLGLFSGHGPGLYDIGNPVVALVTTNLASTPVPPGTDGSGLTSTNLTTNPGGDSGASYGSTNLDATGTNGFPIAFTSTNTSSANNGTLIAGFDALFTAEVRVVQAVQAGAQSTAAGLSQVNSSVAGLGSSLTTGNGLLGQIGTNTAGLGIGVSNLNGTMGGVSNGVAGLSNAVYGMNTNLAASATANGLLISNAMAGVSSNINRLATNPPVFDTNADNLLASISNSVKQPDGYTNEVMAALALTNVAVIAGGGTAAVGTNLDGFTTLEGDATAASTAMSGWSPGTIGTGMTVTFPVLGAINFDPASMGNGVSDVVGWIRSTLVWATYVLLIFKILDELWKAMAIVFVAPQGRFPQISILGNTLGAGAAPAYVVGLCLVMTAAIVAFLAFFGQFTGNIIVGSMINPFTIDGVSSGIANGIKLLNEFVPLGLVIQAGFFWLFVRLAAVKLVIAASVIVRAFIACLVVGFLAQNASASDVGPSGFVSAITVPVVVDNGLTAAVELRVADGGGTYRFSFVAPAGFGRETVLWLPDSTSTVEAYLAGIGMCAVTLDLTSTNLAHVSVFTDGTSIMAGTHYSINDDVGGLSDAEWAWFWGGFGLSLSIWGWAWGKRLIASMLGSGSDVA